jgi:transcriptional regulator with XRE-family HTH domain
MSIDTFICTVYPRIVQQRMVLYDSLSLMDKKQLLHAVASGIKARRALLGMTIAELAEAADIDGGYLAHVETAARAPSLAVLAAILKALGMSPEELFRGRTPKGSQRADELTRRTRALLRRVNRDQQDDLIAIFSKLRGPAEIKALRVLLRA